MVWRVGLNRADPLRPAEAGTAAERRGVIPSGALCLGPAAAAVAAAVLGFARPAAGQSIPVTVGGPASSLVGVQFELPIQVDLSARTERLGSFAIRLQWNPAVLKVDSGVDGNFGEVYVHRDSMLAGVLRLTGANPMGVAGKVALGIGYAQPLLADTTTIRVQVLEMYAARSFVDLLPNVTTTNRAYCPALGRYGDLNADGAIAAADAQIALMAAVGLPLPAGTQVAVGDIDGDGITDTRDALIILSRVVDLNTGTFRLLRIAPGACGADKFFALAIPPGDQVVVAGQKIQFVAAAVDSSQNAAVAAGVTWSSTNTTVATVDNVGMVTAVAAGSTVITAKESGGRQGSATVTVVAGRTSHWVDALAFNATNQLGSAELPFSAIQPAVGYARPGDTIHVRPGRYEEQISIGSSLVIVGEPGLDGVKPVIAGRGGPFVVTSGITVTGGTRVELHRLQLDTLYQALKITFADTVLVREVDFQASDRALASIRVDSITALLVQRSRFVGAGLTTFAFANNAIYVARKAKLVSVDSSLISDYRDDGLLLYGIDSLFVRGSIIRDNYGQGVYVCNVCFLADTLLRLKAVFSGNRWRENRFGHVSLSRVYRGVFDHNVATGFGYDAFQLFGDSTTLVTLRGDSIKVRDFGSWLHVSGYDSVAVDSVNVSLQSFGAGYSFFNGRVLAVTNSRFRDLEFGTAVFVNPSPRASSRLVLQNVEFVGSAGCDRCAYGVQTYQTQVEAQGVSATNVYQLFGVYSGSSLRLRGATVGRSYYVLYASCSSAWLDQLTATASQYGITVSGCLAPAVPESLVVDSSAMSLGFEAINTYPVHTVVTRSVFTDYVYGMFVNSGSLVASDNQFLRIRNESIDYFGGGEGPGTIARNTISCASPPYPYFVAPIDAGDAAITITGNTISNCSTGILGSISSTVLAAGTPYVVRGNTITVQAAGGYYAINVGGARGAFRIVGNTISGPAYLGSILVAQVGTAKAEVDSNTIASVGYGIEAGGVDDLSIQDNVITGHRRTNAFRSAAIRLSAAAATNLRAAVRRNRITNAQGSSGIVLYRSFGDTVTTLVDSNVVKGADTVGIWVGGYAKAKLRWNAIDSTGSDAVRISEAFRGGNPIDSIANNNLSRSRRYGINNALGGVTPPLIIAENNYWGAAGGPRGAAGNQAALAPADSVSANVDWDPYLTAPGAAPLPAPPAGVVALAPFQAHVPAPGAGVLEGAAVTDAGAPPAAPPSRPAAPERPRQQRLPRFVPEGSGDGALVVAADRIRADVERERERERQTRDAARQALEEEIASQRAAAAAERAARDQARRERREQRGGGTER